MASAWHRCGDDETCRERLRAKRRREYSENPARHAEYNRRNQLKRRFGITSDEYDSMLESQGGVCAICGEADPTGRRLAVDHNHETGEVRGLLCIRCNRGIGNFKDSPALLQAAAEYLQ